MSDVTEPMSDERRAEIERLRPSSAFHRPQATIDAIDELLAEVDRQAAELEQLRPVVESARAFLTARFVDRDTAERSMYDALVAALAPSEPEGVEP